MSKEVIFILVIVSMAIWIMVSREGCETFKRDKLAENDNITVCGNFICISYNHYAFSKPTVIVPLTGAYVEQEGCYGNLFSYSTNGQFSGGTGNINFHFIVKGSEKMLIYYTILTVGVLLVIVAVFTFIAMYSDKDYTILNVGKILVALLIGVLCLVITLPSLKYVVLKDYDCRQWEMCYRNRFIRSFF